MPRVKVTVVPGGKTRILEFGAMPRVRDILEKLGIPLEAAVVVRTRDVKPLLPDEHVGDGEDVTVYVAASTG
ncbi:hypothetical protein [Hyperthermus butylicus]|uniref:Conserved archaeal protein n=1 Tax=Hyperthermus butylicus (strain DSM 5456 / JCM 9403 / PLM1-5) TaxID=415426 RepID=A2BJ07_HYPBU|nr:hypothetical protein [Hyperthermus butylicus]ABM79968.1 conserved archaeal protein [Hyperthermus butylicus DSM 5456]